MASPTVHCKITIPFDIYLSSRCHCAARCLGSSLEGHVSGYNATQHSTAQHSLDTFTLCNNVYLLSKPGAIPWQIYLSILAFVLYTSCNKYCIFCYFIFIIWLNKSLFIIIHIHSTFQLKSILFLPTHQIETSAASKSGRIWC